MTASEEHVATTRSLGVTAGEGGQPLAPDAALFPRLPSSWYFAGPARPLSDGPASAQLGKQRLVIFRAADGRLAALDARCSHQGADLSRGWVEGNAIHCPFHGWSFDASGVCTAVPGLCEIPSFAHQRTYAIRERHGLLFVFSGERPSFPLPFFENCVPGDFAAGRPFHFVAECPWYVLVSNGFDVAHFQSVHDRRMLGRPVVDEPHPFERRLRVQWEVTGDSAFDRLLRLFVGRTVDVSISNWGGTMTLVTGRFRRAKSYILIASAPRNDGRTDVNVVVFAPRRKPRWLDAVARIVALEIRRLFTRAFLRDDIERLVGIRYRPERFTAADAEMAAFYRWLAQLPQEDSTPCSD
jgi:aminopyrrolnitrin oxygenase